MKRFISIILVFVLVFSLTGCVKVSNETSITTSNSTSTSTEISTSVEASTETSVSIENVEPEPVPVVFSNSKFANASRMYFGESSTELNNKTISLYPVDDTKVVVQIKNYDATEDQDIPLEMSYAFTFSLVDEKTLKHNESDQNGVEEGITITLSEDETLIFDSSMVMPFSVDNRYMAMGDADGMEPNTMLEFVRNIPEANIGDFGLYNPYDEVEDSVLGDWFHELKLYREGSVLDTIFIADDLSVILKADNEQYSIIYGSLENTVNHVFVYYLYNDETDSYEEYPAELVYAYVSYGSTMIEGNVTDVCVEAPLDMVESLTVSSSDTNIISVSDNLITAVAPGEAVISATFVYGGVSKTSEIPVTVIEYDPNAEYFEINYIDEKYSSFQDSVSQRATLDICFEDGVYAVDILWGDGAETTHHWSYIGEAYENGNLFLKGTYYIEHSETEEWYDEIVAADITGMLIRGEDGNYYWNDDHEDAGKDCVFEPVIY